MVKQLLTLVAAATTSVGVFAQDATIINTYDAIWEFYNEDNETWEKPDESGMRTLEQYSDGTYKILDAFGSGAEKDVLTFVKTEDNITFLGLKTNEGVKYIYYNGTEYSYVYDSEADGGEYSEYTKEDGYDLAMFYIWGSAGNGYYCLFWQEPEVKDVTAICGTYNVDKFTGYSSYWYEKSTSWVPFSFDEYDVEITQVEGNEVALSGLTNGIIFYGEYNAAESTISFPVQQVYGEDYPNYYFCAEEWDEDGNMIFNPDKPVVATINEDGSISFNNWTIVWLYDDGSVWGYFCYVETELSKKSSGVKAIYEENTNGPVQYFNLQGMSVNQDNLRPGIYIVRQGNQARKVLVK